MLNDKLLTFLNNYDKTRSYKLSSWICDIHDSVDALRARVS